MAENKKSSIGGKSSCHLLNIKQPDRAAKRIKLSFQRTRATLSVLKLNKTVEASLGLIDMSDSGAGLFTGELLLKGSSVDLCITEPMILRVRAIVAWSVPVHSGIQKARFPFRSGLQFVFENETQRTTVLDFMQRVQLDPLERARSTLNAPAPAVEAAPAEAPPAAEVTAESTPSAEGTAPDAQAAPAGTNPPAQPEPAAAEAPDPENSEPKAA
jgi:hypothetical protein